MGTTESRPRRNTSSAFLPKPITDTYSEAAEADGFRYGLACMQGWRAHMEDAHILTTTITGLPGWAFFAVLDGHAGEQVAQYSEHHLTSIVLEEVVPVSGSLVGIKDALRRAFLRHDRSLESNFELLRSRSGTTCTSVMMTPTDFIFANLGDSRAVLSRGGKAVFATDDHKPSLPEEAQRIREAGGMVINGRVDGGLAVSRAFGDFEYKMRSDLAQTRQKVIAEPTVTSVERRPREDEFLLLACDGIWDVMTNQQAVKFVHTKLRRGAQDLQQVCQRLVRRCLELGSRDNMSVVLIVFDENCRQPRMASTRFGVEELYDVVASSVARNAVMSALHEVCDAKGRSVLPPPSERETIFVPPNHAGIQGGQLHHQPRSSAGVHNSESSSSPSMTQPNEPPPAAQPVHVLDVLAEDVDGRSSSSSLHEEEAEALLQDAMSVSQGEPSSYQAAQSDSARVVQALTGLDLEDAQGVYDDGGYLIISEEEELDEDA